MDQESKGGRHCDNCGKPIGKKETMYRLRLELFANADPLEFDLEDLEAIKENALADFIESLEHVDAEEATDQVYEAYAFSLCSACRADLHRKLKSRAEKKTFPTD